MRHSLKLMLQNQQDKSVVKDLLLDRCSNYSKDNHMEKNQWPQALFQTHADALKHVRVEYLLDVRLKP